MQILKLLKTPGAVGIVLLNLYPIFAVLFEGWSVFSVMLFFWFENVIIGVFLIVKLWNIPHKSILGKPIKGPALILRVLPPVFGYAVFTHFHGFFINIIFGYESGVSFKYGLGMLSKIIEPAYAWGFFSILIYYAVVYIKEKRRKKKFDGVQIVEVMMSPFIRIALLQIALIFGGGIVMIFGAPILALLFLVLLKIFLDLVLSKLGEGADQYKI